MMNKWYEVRRMVAERFMVPDTEVDPQTNLRKDLNAEKLDIMELILAMQTYLNAPEDEETDPEDIVLAGDLMNLLSEKMFPELDERQYETD